MSPILAAFLRSAAAPATVVAVVIFLTGTVREPLRSRVQAGVLALGFLVGNWLLMGKLELPPATVGEALSYAALGLAAFVVIFPGIHQAPYLVRALFVALLGALIVYHLGAQLNTYVHKRNLAAFFFLGLGVWSIYERNVNRVGMLSLIGLPVIAATGVSFLMLFAASASLSQMVSILCTILGGLTAIALVAPKRLSKAALVPFLSVFIILMMAAGHFYLDINPWKMVFLCVPYLVVWCRGFIPFVPKHPVLEFIVLAVLTLIPLGYLLYNSFIEAGPLY